MAMQPRAQAAPQEAKRRAAEAIGKNRGESRAASMFTLDSSVTPQGGMCCSTSGL